MHLHMYINDELIDSIEINSSLLSKIRVFQQQLEEKHSENIDLSKSEPTYCIEGVPSRMNQNPPHKKIIYN